MTAEPSVLAPAIDAGAARPRREWRRFAAANLPLVVSGTLLAVIILAVIVFPFFLVDPSKIDPFNQLEPPSAAHWMGTDQLGRDVFSQMMTAGRVSIGMTFLITMCAATLGTFIGVVSGYFVKAGHVIMRIVDVWMSFPAIILAILFAVVIGPGIVSEVLAMTAVFTPFTARIIRSRALSLATRTYVKSARVAGMGAWKTLAVHLLPNILPLALVQVVLIAAAAMLIDGSLSFLGLGVMPPTPTWGNMIAQGRDYMVQEPTLVIFPGLAIAVFVFLLNIAGTSLRSIIDPRVRMLQEQRRLRRGRT